ncbi:PREDICTED: gametogenetin-like [Erythranthe guttata]|uniref:gametogenetin-like n=1 Tax=Erythranthe guttata TaxID=4155 RepID=UPI00064DA462|nr:PREDICTED: gametogenetin-like [Erythranthe guttata]|eukprot:XP_012835534.1 PREDICTED: gametogenetin-like [Erythranthe guttata]
MALPLRFIEAVLFLTPASDSNFGNLMIISASRLSPPPSPPVTPPSLFTYSPPSPPSSPLPPSQTPPPWPPIQPSPPHSAPPPPPPSSAASPSSSAGVASSKDAPLSASASPTNKGKGKFFDEEDSEVPPPTASLHRSRRRAPPPPTNGASTSHARSTAASSEPDLVLPICAADAFNHRLFLPSNQSWWYLVSQRALASECPLGHAFDDFGITDILRRIGILDTVSRIEHFESQAVYDFYANLSHGVSDCRSPFYEHVYVFKRVYEFNSARIAELFDLHTVGVVAPTVSVISTLTGGQSGSWPLRTTSLTMTYRVLFSIGAANWFPTAHHGVMGTLSYLDYVSQIVATVDSELFRGILLLNVTKLVT